MQLVITWEMVGIAVTALIALFGLLVGIIKWLLDRYVEAVKAQIGMMASQITANAGEITRLDKEILKLRAEVARDCFTRDDHIRYETVINAKVDALGTKIENLMLRSAHAHS
jgi:hypothetical protein